MNAFQHKAVVILLGPTGAGKTGLSLLLAKELGTEIISADSMLVYRHMDIGTAKPSAEELEAVPHHLVNILSPSGKFSAGLFKEKATETINDLHSRNKIPVIVGGTGLYIRSLTRGLFDGPGADEALRKALKEQEEAHGKGYLYNRLKTVDPETAGKIEPNDTRRIIRALEVIVKEKKALSEIRQTSTRPSDYAFVKIGLTRDRKELYRIIEDRVDTMISRGLLREAGELLKLNPGRTALQALGYKEMHQYIDGRVDMDEAVRLIKKRTKMYAKRQFTWFKKETGVQWVDITGMTDAGEIFSRTVNSVEILNQLIYS